MGKNKRSRASDKAPAKEEPVHSGHNRHTPATRKSCVVACAQALVDGKVDYGLAGRLYKKVRKQLGGDKLAEDPKPVLKGRWDHFVEYGDVEDNLRTGRPVLISREDALTASTAIKAGRLHTKTRKGHTITLISYFTTVRQATVESDAVKGVMQKYNCTPHQLYNAMMREDPNLGRRSFALKYRLTEKEKAARKSFCKQLLAEWNVAQALLNAILARIVQCDEGRWAYNTYTHAHVRAYVDLQHLPLHDYVSLPTIKGDKQQTVHFFICVSAHPSFSDKNGLVYYELTTGTTHILRWFNKLGQEGKEPFVYQRKDGADAASTVTDEVADNLYKMVEKFRNVTGEDPIIMMDNVRIQANIPDKIIESRYGTITLPEGCRLRFPPHSSDIDQLVEHSIGAVKGAATDKVFDECCHGVVFSGESLRRIFKGVFKRFEKGELYHRGVERNMRKLPTVLRIIASGEDEWFTDPDGKQHHGSNGDWPNAGDR